ncbi:MAG TPA: UbiX family flavin prenyltransferase [Candidatus Lachnoclostridium pullistercoris]|uniref:UbiX family flavin prenyltransferase n=1 Tax=Candidatus Lachnoclostridium pullistercoris TaxID=2838632 RepID=A0A9D2PCN3_9FIRM|nr:UbiX family flavin prenyltransferase [Candidatus Lachnoclostridium pullistercoris]
MEKKRIIVGATGASGMPILEECLKIIRQDKTFSSYLIMSSSGEKTCIQEMGSAEAVYQYADEILDWKEIGRGPASGSFQTAGMLIVPCSMKTAAGICCGYSDNLILRAADVTIKEQRPLVLAARETPVSAIHLRNLAELARLPGVHIIPPMMTFYHQPKTIQEMVHHIAAKLLEPFGIEAEGYRRWTGI